MLNRTLREHPVRTLEWSKRLGLGKIQNMIVVLAIVKPVKLKSEKIPACGQHSASANLNQSC
jgi:hypothetical protein